MPCVGDEKAGAVYKMAMGCPATNAIWMKTYRQRKVVL